MRCPPGKIRLRREPLPRRSRNRQRTGALRPTRVHPTSVPEYPFLLQMVDPVGLSCPSRLSRRPTVVCGPRWVGRTPSLRGFSSCLPRPVPPFPPPCLGDLRLRRCVAVRYSVECWSRRGELGGSGYAPSFHVPPPPSPSSCSPHHHLPRRLRGVSPMQLTVVV